MDDREGVLMWRSKLARACNIPRVTGRGLGGGWGGRAECPNDVTCFDVP